MSGLYIVPGNKPEEVEFSSAEKVLGDAVDLLYPFLDENIAVAVLLDQDDQPENMALLDEDLYELEVLKGPVLIFREDEEDLTEEDLDFIQKHIRCRQHHEEHSYERDGSAGDWNVDEEDSDDPDDESFSPIHIVDGATFGEMLRNERTDEQKYF